MSGDEGIGFLAFSLPEAVSASLAGLRSLTVRSSLLAAQLDARRDLRSIAEEADVDMLLYGRIHSDAGRLRIITELVDAHTAALVGSFICHAARENIFELQDGLVRRIVELLLPQLSEHEMASLSRDVPRIRRSLRVLPARNSRGAPADGGQHVHRARPVPPVSRLGSALCSGLGTTGKMLRVPGEVRSPRGKRLRTVPVGISARVRAQPRLSLAHNHYTQIEADSGHALRAMVRLLGQAKKFPNNPELFSGWCRRPATAVCWNHR